MPMRVHTRRDHGVLALAGLAFQPSPAPRGRRLRAARGIAADVRSSSAGSVPDWAAESPVICFRCVRRQVVTHGLIKPSRGQAAGGGVYRHKSDSSYDECRCPAADLIR
jgi:hypothetical protein